ARSTTDQPDAAAAAQVRCARASGAISTRPTLKVEPWAHAPRSVINATAEAPRAPRQTPRNPFRQCLLGVFLGVLGASAVAFRTQPARSAPVRGHGPSVERSPILPPLTPCAR